MLSRPFRRTPVTNNPDRPAPHRQRQSTVFETLVCIAVAGSSLRAQNFDCWRHMRIIIKDTFAPILTVASLHTSPSTGMIFFRVASCQLSWILVPYLLCVSCMSGIMYVFFLEYIVEYEWEFLPVGKHKRGWYIYLMFLKVAGVVGNVWGSSSLGFTVVKDELIDICLPKLTRQKILPIFLFLKVCPRGRCIQIRFLMR